jgi:hypothetical protein
VQDPVPDADTKEPVSTPEEFVQRMNPEAGVPGKANCAPEAATVVGAIS